MSTPHRRNDRSDCDDDPWVDPGEQWLVLASHPMPSVPEVDYDPDDNGYIGTLLGPDGSDLLDVYEQRQPFGFCSTSRGT